MNRQQICDSPDLKDLPYKIELNRRNQIIISPARLMYGAYQSETVKKNGGFGFRWQNCCRMCNTDTAGYKGSRCGMVQFCTPGTGQK